MTFKEKWEQDHKGERFCSVARSMCPYKFGYELKDFSCTKFKNCNECWNRQIPKKENDMKEFTKEDFKDGMTCKMRDGKMYVWFNGRPRNMTGSIVFIKDDLTNEMYDSFDIMQVFDINPYVSSIKEILEEPGKSLWKRKEPKEMTVAEIEEKLGHPVKIIKE